jgi:ADP-ribosylglycohydrolase
MSGVIIGDIIGLRFELNNHRNKEFLFFTEKCFVTDDSIIAIANTQAITGAGAEAYYGIPYNIRNRALTYLDKDLRFIYDERVIFINKHLGKLDLHNKTKGK